MRLISVGMVLIATACVIIALLNVPVYVLIRSQLDAFLQEYTQANLESKSFQDSEQSVARANEIAKLLAADEGQKLLQIVEILDGLTTNAVVITDFSVAVEKKKLKPIVIRGVAPTRLSLTTFRDAIESHEMFETAELPLSNLAKDSDIEFTITITAQKSE